MKELAGFGLSAWVVGPLVLLGIFFQTVPDVRTMADRQGVSFFRLGNFWQFRADRISWKEVVSVEYGGVGKADWPVFHLVGGTDIWARYPSRWREKHDFDEAVADLRRLHLEALKEIRSVGGVDWNSQPKAVPAVSGVRRSVILAASGIVLMSLLPGVIWISYEKSRVEGVREIAACDFMSRRLAGQVFPRGVVQNTGAATKCRWNAGSSGWIDIDVRWVGHRTAQRSYKSVLRLTRSRTPVRSADVIGGDAFITVRSDLGGVTAEGWIAKSGYLMRVALRSLGRVDNTKAVQQIDPFVTAMGRILEDKG